MLPLSRLLRLVYVLALSLAVLLLLGTARTRAQSFGVSTGFRATPALPVIAYPVFSSGSSGVGGGGSGGAAGFGGGGGAGGLSINFSTKPQIVTLDLGAFFPNHGQIVGLPPSTVTPPLNNFGLISIGTLNIPTQNPLFASDTTGAPWAILLAMGAGGGAGGGTVIGGGGAGGGGGIAGVAGGGGIPGGGGIAGGGLGGIGGGGLAGGLGGGGIAGGGLGGFAGKGMGGFNGRKPL